MKTAARKNIEINSHAFSNEKCQTISINKNQCEVDWNENVLLSLIEMF
jgi:hypothetical protein